MEYLFNQSGRSLCPTEDELDNQIDEGFDEEEVASEILHGKHIHERSVLLLHNVCRSRENLVVSTVSCSVFLVNEFDSFLVSRVVP